MGWPILPVVMVAGGLGIFSYMSGNTIYSEYLSVPYLAGAGEILIFCTALVGAGLGFLWFNAYPAQVFMGDVGALSLGAALGVLAVIVRQEIVLMIMGGLFVVETLSVIIQVVSFKLVGRRVFKMAPIHHHFELKGWPETARNCAFLDHQLYFGHRWSCDPQGALVMAHSRIKSKPAIVPYKKVAVIGFGMTGQSVIRYLGDSTMELIAMDTRELATAKRELRRLFPKVRLVTGVAGSTYSGNCRHGSSESGCFGQCPRFAQQNRPTD